MTRNPLLRSLLGEADDLETTAAAPPPRVDADPEIEQPSEPPAVEDEDETPEGSSLVNELASAWQSGSRIDVASRLMYTPISYADFVRVVYMIGQDGAMELGRLLDELASGAEEGNGQDVSPLVRQAAGPEPEAAPEAGAELPPDEAEEQRT